MFHNFYFPKIVPFMR